MGRNIAFLCIFLFPIIFASLIGDVNAKAFGSSDPFGNGGFGSDTSGHNRMHDPFGNSNSFDQPKFPSSDPFSQNSHFGGSSGMSSSFGSSGGHSSFGDSDPFASDFFQSNKKISTTTDSAAGIASGFEKLGEAFQQAAGVPGKAISVTRNITDPNSPISSITFTSGVTKQQNTGSNSAVQQSGNDQDNSHTEVQHIQYSYRPPSAIHFQTSKGYETFPVYSGTLPPYVYEYSSSGNKYSNLLAGLALYNLGKVYSNPQMQNFHEAYVSQGDEHCKFGVRYTYKLNDEMAINCKSITSFLYQEKPITSLLSSETNKNLQQATSLVNQNIQSVLSSAFDNGSHLSSSLDEAKPINDPKFHGRPLEVSSDMDCFVTRTARFSSTINTSVPCGLLQTYSTQSLVSSATMVKSTFSMLVLLLVYYIMH